MRVEGEDDDQERDQEPEPGGEVEPPTFAAPATEEKEHPR